MKNWLRIAHRGASAHAPENTLASFRLAVEMGTDGVEMDVHVTGDGEVVVLHDATLDRTTDRIEHVAQMAMSDIRAADAGVRFSEAFVGERVPTLDEAFDVLPANTLAVVELKVRDAALPVAEIVRKANRLDQTVVISFIPETLREIRFAEPRIATSLLIGSSREGPQPTATSLIQQAFDVGTSCLDLQWELATEAAIAHIHRLGGSVWTWTVDSPADMARLVNADVDAITSNYPDRLNDIKSGAR